MRRSFLGRTIPAALTLLSLTIPVVTGADVLLHTVTSTPTLGAGVPVPVREPSLPPVGPPSSRGSTVSSAGPAQTGESTVAAAVRPAMPATPVPTAVVIPTAITPPAEVAAGIGPGDRHGSGNADHGRFH